MLFDHDWWFGTAWNDRIEAAKQRCVMTRFPDAKPDGAKADPRCAAFLKELEARTIIYLRDGFSYEVKAIVPGQATSALTFECTPADEAYKVGCFVVTVPYDDIIRVEVFAYPAREKPEDMPAIKGFAGGVAPSAPPKRVDERPGRREGAD